MHGQHRMDRAIRHEILGPPGDSSFLDSSPELQEYDYNSSTYGVDPEPPRQRRPRVTQVDTTTTYNLAAINPRDLTLEQRHELLSQKKWTAMRVFRWMLLLIFVMALFGWL